MNNKTFKLFLAMVSLLNFSQASYAITATCTNKSAHPQVIRVVVADDQNTATAFPEGEEYTGMAIEMLCEKEKWPNTKTKLKCNSGFVTRFIWDFEQEMHFATDKFNNVYWGKNFFEVPIYTCVQSPL